MGNKRQADATGVVQSWMVVMYLGGGGEGSPNCRIIYIYIYVRHGGIKVRLLSEGKTSEEEKV